MFRSIKPVMFFILAVVILLPVNSAFAKKKKEESKEKTPGKSFEVAVKGYQKIEGLFTFYVNEDSGKRSTFDHLLSEYVKQAEVARL